MISLLLAASIFCQSKPNVVLFLVDDLGWQDTSLKFGLDEKLVGRHLRTPNLEKLAARGVQVNQAYSSCPVCTPSRVALLTGKNPARIRITSWVQLGQDTAGRYPGIKLPAWKTDGLQPGEAKTLAEVFREAGYRTAQVGKAHFAAAGFPGANPTNLGFDISVAGSAGGHPNSYYGQENFAAKKQSINDRPKHNDVPGLNAYHGKDVYLEEALAIEGSKIISNAAKDGKPLFLWYAPFAVHTPLMPNRRLSAKYGHLAPQELAYATMVESFDNAIGELLASLEKAGQLDNTYFVFTSDNGGLSDSARAGYPNLHNLPLRSGKGSAYEGGTRVPLVIAGPSVPKGKSLVQTWVTGADIYATLSEFAGLKVGETDGKSFATNVLSLKEETTRGPVVWHYPHNRGGGGPGLEPFTSVRLNDFKAIFFYGSRRWELYNLKSDLGETRNLSIARPDKLNELANTMMAELKRMGAQLPVDEKTGTVMEPISFLPPTLPSRNGG